MKTNPLLFKDFYKACHAEMYPGGLHGKEKLTKIVAYYTPRISRLIGQNKLVHFELQGFIKEYLIEAFNDNFFSRPESEIVDEYERLMTNTVGAGVVNCEKIRKLHRLGYLPIEIISVPEGTRVPVKVPMFGIANTHPDFAWLVNTLETMLSCTLWHAQLSANVGYMYRQIVNEYYDKTVDDDVPRASAVGDFSMRGQESVESAIKSSAGFALSFLNTATVPVVPFFERYYNANSDIEPVAYGLTSTEHSVMCSNYAVDGDEITMLRRLLTKLYPNNSFNMVSDSYDYWNVVDNLLPQAKREVLAHKGFIGIRGDSGDPVEISTQTVFSLWKTFGGTVNSKGYKVLDPHVKAVYGDSITPQRLKAIYDVLTKAGFACNNVSLASGSFSMQCLEESNNSALAALDFLQGALPAGVYANKFDEVRKALELAQLNPFTRDTFGVAIKSTYCEVNGVPIQIFKDPKTDMGNFKKSQKGMCVVFHNEEGELDYRDGYSAAEIEAFEGENLLKPVFRDGKMVREQSLQEIRAILHDNKF